MSTLRAGVELYALQTERHLLLEELKQQKATINKQQNEWLKLQNKHPTLLKVSRDEDGNIILSDDI